ncbi:MAG: PQQ-dependent sugar dehydrogenase [Planctomycetes bacterium]|nr:PQQ-dependent sugar dehydrogenase [Planctomycetota bacterium]
MNRFLWFAAFLSAMTSSSTAGEKLPKPLVDGLHAPRSVAVGGDGRIYISEPGKDGEEAGARILAIDKGKTVPFATGLDASGAMVAWTTWLFVAQGDKIWRIDRKGKAEVFVAPGAFSSPVQLQGITVDEQGVLYVTSNTNGHDGAIFRVDPKGKVRLVTSSERAPDLKTPKGVVMDGKSHLLVADIASGKVLRVKIADGSATTVAAGFGEAWNLAWDRHGRLYVSSGEKGKLFVIPRPGEEPIPVETGPITPADICLDPTGKYLLVLDAKAGALMALRAAVPGQEVDDSPMPLATAVAFPDLKWTGWQGMKDDGRPFPLRPLLLTHAGDGSNRVFVGIQQGVIHVFSNDPKAARTKIFLDIQKRVRYDDKENEEGFLGLVFHPNYKKNGEFFVFYTLKEPKRTNVVSRFRVSKDDPDQADPDSEEELLRITRPYWNHDGGTLCFGPDGFLYIALGDGGAADDPHKNGQNLKSLLAKVLRIDVDRKEGGKNYAIPPDNPFVGKKDALPEIWAYGLRNVWRMAFDRKTGKLWASDVGQNLYEEIDIIVAGGNYGWSVREGLHPFGKNGAGLSKDLIDPIWEYHHDVGKSLTGGTVYRGKRLPELDGYYLYGDYVTAKIWALRYDEIKKRVVANRPIRDPNVPILSFGEDEQGEVYFMTTTTSGQGIYRFTRVGNRPPG